MNIIIAVILGVLAILAVGWNKNEEADKWERFSKTHDCKPISAKEYKCNNGTFTKP